MSKQRWRKLSEEKPEDGTRVLTSHFIRGKYTEPDVRRYHEDGSMWVADVTYRSMTEDIWMPLPELPKP